jgi:hypothetical protein
LAGVAIAVRAMEKFAVLGIDWVGIAHSQRAAATNRDTSNVVPGFLAGWHLGSRHVAGLEASNGPGAHARARETVCRQLGPAVGPSCARLDCERRLLPADERSELIYAVLQADRERVAAMYNRPAAFEKQVSPLLGARHYRPPALIEDEYRQISSPKLLVRGPLPFAGNLPRGQDPFRANPWLVCCLAFERSELKKASGRRF